MPHARKRFSSRGGFAIYLWMAITGLLMVVGVSMVEKLYPASKNVKGMEQGNMAYYFANSAVERAMLSLTGTNPALEPSGSAGSPSTAGFKYQTYASGTVIPNPGYGNSEFSPDKNWNLLGIGRPAQFRLTNTNIGAIQIEFRAPDVDANNVFRTDGGGNFLSEVTTSWMSNFTQSVEQQAMFDRGAMTVAINENDYGTNDLLKGGAGVALNWVISAGAGALLSTEASAISFDMINLKPNQTNGGKISLGGLSGKLLDGTVKTIDQFSTDNCVGVGKVCILKLAIVNPPILANDVGVPYIEYKLHGPGGTMPQQWIRITAEGYERGYRQSVTREIRQITTGEAMDFTVFQ